MLGELKRNKTILKKDYKPIPDALKKKLKGVNREAEVFWLYNEYIFKFHGENERLLHSYRIN